MQGEVVTETDVVVWCGSVVEGHAVAHVVDGGVVSMFGVLTRRLVAVSVHDTVVFQRPQLGQTVGVHARDVGEELRREDISPVQGSVEVAPIEMVLGQILLGAMIAIVYASAVIGVVAHGTVAVVIFVARRELVLSPVGAQRQPRSVAEEMCHLGVEVVEEVRDVHLIVILAGVVVDV